MRLTSQQHASLADASYEDHFPKKNPYAIGGVEYKALENYSDPHTGYQVAVYQRVDASELIFAQRGTEKAERLGELLSDGIMVALRLNPQAEDVIALTPRALDYVERDGRKPAGHVPQITVIGHSLRDDESFQACDSRMLA